MNLDQIYFRWLVYSIIEIKEGRIDSFDDQPLKLKPNLKIKPWNETTLASVKKIYDIF